jgi:hypothetical protein
MSIEVEKLHSITSKTLGASGKHFDEMFVSAVNDVSRVLSMRTFLSPPSVTKITDTLSVDEKYVTVYKDGVRYFMSQMGEWGRQPSENEGAIWQRSFADASAESMIDEDPDVGFVR